MPINAQVVVQFSEPVDGLTLNQVTVSGNGGAVQVMSRLSNGNQTLTLAPLVTLSASATYTVSVSGVKDLSGNALTAPVTTTFTIGTGADLTLPSVTAASPANGATGVATTGVIQLQFSKPVDPLTITTGDFLVVPQATGIPISGSIATSADGSSATFTPGTLLFPFANYLIQATGGILDLAGQPLQPFISSFQIGNQ